jgi:hypothetical protein
MSIDGRGGREGLLSIGVEGKQKIWGYCLLAIGGSINSIEYLQEGT